jgi:hypothetical protein
MSIWDSKPVALDDDSSILSEALLKLLAISTTPSAPLRVLCEDTHQEKRAVLRGADGVRALVEDILREGHGQVVGAVLQAGRAQSDNIEPRGAKRCEHPITQKRSDALQSRYKVDVITSELNTLTRMQLIQRCT